MVVRLEKGAAEAAAAAAAGSSGHQAGAARVLLPTVPAAVTLAPHRACSWCRLAELLVAASGQARQQLLDRNAVRLLVQVRLLARCAAPRPSGPRCRQGVHSTACDGPCCSHKVCLSYGGLT